MHVINAITRTWPYNDLDCCKTRYFIRLCRLDWSRFIYKINISMLLLLFIVQLILILFDSNWLLVVGIVLNRQNDGFKNRWYAGSNCGDVQGPGIVHHRRNRIFGKSDDWKIFALHSRHRKDSSSCAPEEGQGPEASIGGNF